MSHEESVILKLDSGEGLLYYNNGDGSTTGYFDLKRNFNDEGAKYNRGSGKPEVTFQSDVTITNPPHPTYKGQGRIKIEDYKVANKLMVSINLAHFYSTHPALIRSDRFRLQRFIQKYDGTNFDTALQEIGSGKKRGCWFWWFVPTPPLIKHGVETGSKTNQIYAIRDAFSIEEQTSEYKIDGYMHAARAYLLQESLRNKYNQMIQAIMDQINKRKYDVIGNDIHKLVSSLEMFTVTCNECKDRAPDEITGMYWQQLSIYYDYCLMEVGAAIKNRNIPVVGKVAPATGAVMVRATENPEINRPLFNPVHFGTTQFQYMKGSVVNFGKEFPGVTPDKMAIVNAANIGGVGGGELDEAIGYAGGNNLYIDRRDLPIIHGKRINVGGAVITSRKSEVRNYGRLHVNNVIHAVGPNFASTASTSARGTIEDLESAYRESLQLCIDNEITHVGFCPLSAGVFKGDKDLGLIIQTGEDAIREFLEGKKPEDNCLQIVHFILFTDKEEAALRDRPQ